MEICIKTNKQDENLPGAKVQTVNSEVNTYRLIAYRFLVTGYSSKENSQTFISYGATQGFWSGSWVYGNQKESGIHQILDLKNGTIETIDSYNKKLETYRTLKNARLGVPVSKREILNKIFSWRY